MTNELESCIWPEDRIAEAVRALAALHRLVDGAGDGDAACAPTEVDDDRLQEIGDHLGLEVEAVHAVYTEFPRLLRRAAPAILRVPGGGYLLLCGTVRGRVALLGPDHITRRVTSRTLRRALFGVLDREASNTFRPVLQASGLTGDRLEHCSRALATELLGTRAAATGWILRPGDGAPLRQQLREARVPAHFAVLVASRVCQYGLLIAAWYLLGKGVLDGRLDLGWIAAWGLLLASLLPCQLVAARAEGELALRGAAIIKRRLLRGATRLHDQEVRTQGIGQLLGRVYESAAIEQLALSGGFLTLTALVELVAASAVLMTGALGGVHAAVLCAVLGAALALAWRCHCHQDRWTRARTVMTNTLVEGMVGNRTRRIQEARERWNDGEDAALSRYHELSATFDRSLAALLGLVPRGWLAVGLLCLAPGLVGGRLELAGVAIALGGILLGYQGFRNLVDGASRLGGAAIAWRGIAGLWSAAARTPAAGSLSLTPGRPRSGDEGTVLLEGRHIEFSHGGRRQPVLSRARLEVRDGDRILLGGASGSGKSTLASLLSGSRDLDGGVLLLRGLDLETLGTDTWRRRVIGVPQFHENHVFQGTLAYNLLLGRAWPPSPEDLQRAEQVCVGLGLGPLLERMPAGLHQIVGETGWSLSHGERSRVFMARALLQDPDLMILDESFGALDPETLERTMRFTLDQARTVMVIEHP